MNTWVRKICVLLGLSVLLVAAGVANTGPVLAQPVGAGATAAWSSAEAAPLDVPACVTRLPPSGSFYRDVRYSQPNACLKCQAAGAAYEALGKFDAHCQNLLNPAGTVTAVQLWLRCIACRTAPAFVGVDPEL